MSVLSDIIKTGTESVITELSEDSVTLTVGASVYSIKCVVTDFLESFTDSGNFEIAQKGKKFTFVKPVGVTVSRDSYITYLGEKYNLADITGGYGNILIANGIKDTTQAVKIGATRIGR